MALDDVVWNPYLGSFVSVRRMWVAVAYILRFLRLRPKTGSPLARRPDHTLFARKVAETMILLDDLIHKLKNCRLQLFARKKIAVLTSKVQLPSFLHFLQW